LSQLYVQFLNFFRHVTTVYNLESSEGQQQITCCKLEGLLVVEQEDLFEPHHCLIVVCFDFVRFSFSNLVKHYG
jgi:hypothetical protein